jgi:FkbM family methyltransferase
MGLLDCGDFEAGVIQTIKPHIGLGATIVDAGANFGWYTTFFSRAVGPNGMVHAFEPMPHTARILRANCTLNQCENVVINEIALGDRERKDTLFLQPGRACGDASLFTGQMQQAQAHPCSVSTLDHYFDNQQVKRCDFIKCDVEGAELLFLKGAAKVLKANRPILLIEINPDALKRAGCTGRDILEELLRHGDYVFEVLGQPSGRNSLLRPTDCDNLKTYVNVLCRTRHALT